MLRSFEICFAFLTIFRVPVDPPPSLEEVGRSAWAFPLVGAAIGFILVLVHWFSKGLLPPVVLSVVLVAPWVVVTGGLHLDGWSDCCDALAASVPPERRLEILKDSRLGTFGAVGLIILLALKMAAVSTTDLPLTMLFLAPVVGRGTMVLISYSAKHGSEGMAVRFISGLDQNSVVAAGIITLAAALTAGWTGILGTVAAFATGLGFRRLAESRLNMVNGDVIGASCELSETVVLLVGCLKW